MIDHCLPGVGPLSQEAGRGGRSKGQTSQAPTLAAATTSQGTDPAAAERAPGQEAECRVVDFLGVWPHGWFSVARSVCVCVAFVWCRELFCVGGWVGVGGIFGGVRLEHQEGLLAAWGFPPKKPGLDLL